MSNNFYETVNKRKTVKGIIALTLLAIVIAIVSVGATILVDYYEIKEIGSNFNTANLCKHFPMAIKVHILVNQIFLH